MNRPNKAFTRVECRHNYTSLQLDNMQSDTIYISYKAGKPKWVSFVCPCGCGKYVALPLMETYNTHWLMEQRDTKVTVTPSVDIVECGAHFFLTDSKVEWC